MIRRPPRSTLFPYTTPLPIYDALGDDTGLEFVEIFNPLGSSLSLSGLRLEAGDGSGPGRWTLRWTGDRKSTRLNASHLVISYAVFCLKKKIDSLQHLLSYVDY